MSIVVTPKTGGPVTATAPVAAPAPSRALVPLRSPLPDTHMGTRVTWVLGGWLLSLGVTVARSVRVGSVFSASLRLTAERYSGERTDHVAFV